MQKTVRGRSSVTSSGNYVFDSLIVKLNLLGYISQSEFYFEDPFWDDLVILLHGKFCDTVLELMMGDLKIVEYWCIRKGLWVNPYNTVLIPFTKERTLTRIKKELLGMKQAFSDEVKTLGFIIDMKFFWNAHI